MAPVEKNNVLVVSKESGGTKGRKVVKRPIQYTSKGRAVIIPKKILPTSSSDEGPRQKSKKLHTSVQKGIQELQALVNKNPKIAAFVSSRANILIPQEQSEVNKQEKKKLNYSPGSAASADTTQLTDRNMVLRNMGELQKQPSSCTSNESGREKTPSIGLLNKKITNHLANIEDPHLFTSHRVIHRRSSLENEPNTGTDLTHLCLQQRSDNDSSLTKNKEKENLSSQSELEFDHAENNLIPVKGSILLDIMNQLRNLEHNSRELVGAIKTIKRDVQCIKGDNDIANARPLFAASEGFPLQTVEEFSLFERDTEKQKKLYSDLRKYGGTKLREALSIAFKASMTDKLATEFTWYGGRNTKNFSTSKLVSLLHRVVKRCENFPGPLSESQFKREMMEVLRAAKQRHRNTAPARNRRRRIEDAYMHEEGDEIADNYSDQEVEDGAEREQNSEEFESEASGSHLGSAAESDAD